MREQEGVASPGDGDRRDQRPRDAVLPGWRRLAGAILLALALAAVAVAVVGHVADFGMLRLALERSDAAWCALCAVAFVLAYGGFVAGYRGVAASGGGPRLDWWTATRVVLIGFAATLVGSTIGGLAVDIWALRRAGAGLHGAARRVVALSALRWLGLVVAGGVAGLAVLAEAEGAGPSDLALGWLIAAPVAVAAVTAVDWPRVSNAVGDLGATAGAAPDARSWRGPFRRLHRMGRSGLADVAGGLAVGRSLLAQPRRHGVALGGLSLFWAGEMLMLYGAVRVFNGHPGVAEVVLAYALAQLVTLIPLPGGGSGGFEAALAAALHLTGLALPVALLAALLFRVFSFWLPGACGLALLPGLPRLSRDLAAIPRSYEAPSA